MPRAFLFEFLVYNLQITGDVKSITWYGPLYLGTNLAAKPSAAFDRWQSSDSTVSVSVRFFRTISNTSFNFSVFPSSDSICLPVPIVSRFPSWLWYTWVDIQHSLCPPFVPIPLLLSGKLCYHCFQSGSRARSFFLGEYGATELLEGSTGELHPVVRD